MPLRSTQMILLVCRGVIDGFSAKVHWQGGCVWMVGLTSQCGSCGEGFEVVNQLWHQFPRSKFDQTLCNLAFIKHTRWKVKVLLGHFVEGLKMAQNYVRDSNVLMQNSFWLIAHSCRWECRERYRWIPLALGSIDNVHLPGVVSPWYQVTCSCCWFDFVHIHQSWCGAGGSGLLVHRWWHW